MLIFCIVFAAFDLISMHNGAGPLWFYSILMVIMTVLASFWLNALKDDYVKCEYKKNKK